MIWRVTLAANGRPLIYDSVHACGCYHLLFPTRQMRQRLGDRLRSDIAERPAVLHLDIAPASSERVAVRLASASHYVVNVAVVPASRLGTIPYGLLPSDALRSLPLHRGRGRRSLFAANGLVTGSERLERFLLWPSGIRNPGAMRQWGNRATAFVDRRHFDDPDLFHQLFRQ